MRAALRSRAISEERPTISVRRGLVGARHEILDSLHQRRQVGVVDQRAGHPDRVAEEEALVEDLAAGEGAARDVPGQSIERDALARGGVGRGRSSARSRAASGICEVGSDGVAIRLESSC